MRLDKRIQANVKQWFNTITNPGLGSFLAGYAPTQWNKQELLKQYKNKVYPIVSAIAEDAAKIDMFTFKWNSDGEKDPVDNHPFWELMNRPNPDMSKFQFLELHFTYFKVAGESFWYLPRGSRSQKPVEAYLIRPDLVSVAVDTDDDSSTGLVTGYKVRRPDGKEVAFEKEEIIHFKMPNPMNPYRGLGPIEASQTYVETENFTSIWTRNSIFNSGRPSTIVNIKGVIGDDEFKKLKRQAEKQYSDPSNAGKMMFVRGIDDVDVKEMGMELGDAALKEIKDLSRDDIMTAFRVSKPMLGIYDDINRASAITAKNLFLESIIKPELERLVDHLNAFLMPVWDDETKVWFKDPVTRSEDEKLKEWQQGIHKWLTVNDVRGERGLEPIEGGDVLYKPANVVPLQQEDQTPTQPVQQEQLKEGQKQKWVYKDTIKLAEKSPACRMPNENEQDCVNRKVPEILEENPEMDRDRAVAIAHEMCAKQCENEHKRMGEKFRQALFEEAEPWVDRYKSTLNEEFETQRKEILSGNKKLTKRELYEFVAGKKELEDWLFDLDASKKRLFGTLTPLTTDIMQSQSRHAFELVGVEPQELEEDERMQRIIRERVDRFSDNVNEETTEQIKDSLSEGMANNETIRELRQRIESIYTDATGYRSERIARTETIYASNESAELSYRQLGVKQKEWHTNPGACEFCRQLEGEIISINDKFMFEGQQLTGNDGGNMIVGYGDKTHPPLHPSCRCTLLPVLDEGFRDITDE